MKKHERKKDGPKRWAPRDGPKKLIFYIRTVLTNRNEIEAPKKKQILIEHPTKKKKMRENEKKDKENDKKKKMMKKERKMKEFGFTRKILDEFQG